MSIPQALQNRIESEVASMVEDLLDDDRTEAPWALCDAIAAELGCATYAIIQEAKRQGLTVGQRGVTKTVRTISSNSHDRWYGPGSCQSHGGSGWQQVQKFAGDEG